MVPDVLAKLILEVRADPDVDAIVDGRVRGVEPKGASASYEGDALGPGAFKAFIVLVPLDVTRMPSVPVQTATIAARCYGRDDIEAAKLRWAVSNALHRKGARVHTNRLGIYQTLDQSGGAPERDPDTRQPLQTFVIIALATTQAVA